MPNCTGILILADQFLLTAATDLSFRHELLADVIRDITASHTKCHKI